MNLFEKINQFSQKIPIAPLMGYPGVKLSNTSLKDNLENADIQVQSLKKLYHKFMPDIMFPMMDLSIEAEALGAKIIKPLNEPFSVYTSPYNRIEEFKKIGDINFLNNGRIPLYLEVILNLKKHLPCIIGSYVIGPFTLAGLLSGTSKVLKNVIKDHDFLNNLLPLLTGKIIKYIHELNSIGSDFICILEPTATNLSPGQFSKFSGKYLKKIKNTNKKPTILHICGDTTCLLDEIKKTDCKGFSFDSMIDLAEAGRIIPEDKFIFGNLDPVNLVAYGKEEEVIFKVKELIKKMSHRKNFVLSTGCDLPLETNLKNIELIFKVARKKFN